jgi:hypothetical protein
LSIRAAARSPAVPVAGRRRSLANVGRQRQPLGPPAPAARRSRPPASRVCQAPAPRPRQRAAPAGQQGQNRKVAPARRAGTSHEPSSRRTLPGFRLLSPTPPQISQFADFERLAPPLSARSSRSRGHLDRPARLDAYRCLARCATGSVNQGHRGAGRPSAPRCLVVSAISSSGIRQGLCLPGRISGSCRGGAPTRSPSAARNARCWRAPRGS